jgi:hypothetical protein
MALRSDATPVLRVEVFRIREFHRVDLLEPLEPVLALVVLEVEEIEEVLEMAV